MKIGVDARPLGAPLTGIGIYTSALLTRLLESEHQWYFYSDRPLIDGPWAGHSRVILRHGQARPQSLESLKIANRDYLRWAARDDLDLFWSPRHHLPFFIPGTLPSVVTIHDLVWRRLPDVLPWQNRLLERLAMGRSLTRAKRVIAVSEFTAAEVAHYYPDTEVRCTVILEAGRALSATAPPNDTAPYFLFVGTSEPRKNLSLLMDAFARLKHIPHRLVVAGGAGWGGIDPTTLALNSGIADRVDVLGYIDDRALGNLYANATALVMPSLYEGFGLPVVEAMSFGVPVIVSDRAALPEVAGDAAVLIDPASPASLSQAMLTLASDTSLWEEYADRAQQRAKAFSWDRAAHETLAVLEAAA